MTAEDLRSASSSARIADLGAAQPWRRFALDGAQPDVPLRIEDGGARTVPSPGVPRPDLQRLQLRAIAAQRALLRRERTYRWSLALADALATALSLALAMSVVGDDRLQPGVLLLLPAVVLAGKVQGLYDRDDLVIHKSTLNEFPRIANLVTLLTLMIWLGRHVIVIGAPSTEQLLALWCLLIATMALGRFIARAIASRRSEVERCLLVGSPRLHNRLAAKFQAGLGHAVLVDSVAVETVATDHQALHDVTSELGIQRVIIAPSDHTDPELTMDLVRAVTASGLRVSLLPTALAAVGSSVAFDDLAGMPLLGVPRFGLSKSSRAIKRSFDLCGAVIAGLLVAPVISIAAVFIKLDSHGPVLFRQTRVGRDGRHFKMVKLRTMIDGADEMKQTLRDRNEAADGLFKITDDPRITRVGRLLRKTSLDELPQLLNVLRGDMSLVGPRPLVVDEDERVTGFDRRRLQLTPGMTGRWQTLGSARIPLSEMVKIDYLYIANWSLWTDVKILLETVAFVLFRQGL
jgi:exopolysaccharide biosynthesis polyprenyl glycosylphosphotransferase